MASTSTRSMVRTPRPRGGADAHEILERLRNLCVELKPGGIVPGHAELMERFDASERAVRWALSELKQQGTIDRRPGAGTIVLENNPEKAERLAEAAIKADGASSLHSDLAQTPQPTSQTVVTIARPDHGVFDYALRLLAGATERKKLFLQCQLVSSWNGAADQFSPATIKPLGYLVFSYRLLPIAQKLQSQGHRVVLIGAPASGEFAGVPNVYVDHLRAGYLAAKHLLELGHRRLVFIGDHQDSQSPRRRGIERAVAEFGHLERPATIEFFEINAEFRWQDNIQRGKDYFTGPQAPTGVISWNDSFALDLLSFLTSIGVRVPQEISIVGCDNLPQSQNSFPPLTTLDANLEYQLEAALDVLETPHQLQQLPAIVTLPNLVSRASTAPPPS